ncbi:MAG: sulfate adenylyltransferase [Betaproteobacteria bacterium]|nr:sulfate adenylyltransferase [Betaproteobacteria bacterium]
MTSPNSFDARPLRFITAGSVDDGKSTLIGRLLLDSKAVLADHLQALSRAKASRLRAGVPPGALDLSLLTDGLEAEREQGITIDVAYRYFATARRKFIVADAPGHEQYTRNMVTGASNSDVAVVLVDVTKLDFTQPVLTLLPQTRRHAALAGLLGLQAIVLAVNKMDAVGYAQPVFDRVVEAFKQFADGLPAAHALPPVHAVPLSALVGDQVVEPGPHMPWYRGPTLLSLLETLDTASSISQLPGASARMAVQYIARYGDRRQYLGRLDSGELRVGDALTVLPAGVQARVQALHSPNGPLDVAVAGQSVNVELDRAVDVSRGDWLVSGGDSPPPLRREFEARAAWLDADALAPGRRYWLRHGTRWTMARVTQVIDRLDLQSLRHTPSDTARTNDIVTLRLATQDALPVAPFTVSREAGAFVLVDASSNRTVAAGMVA